MSLLDVYGTNEDFRLYVDKFSTSYNISVKYAVKLKIVQLYHEYLLNKNK